MKLSDFLRELLPEDGYYYAATWIAKPTYKRGGFWSNEAHNDISDLALALKVLSRDGKDAYFALASYAEPSYLDDAGKSKTRTQDNAVAAKAMWLDLDCGPGKSYATQRDAIKGLKHFLEACGLPRPNLHVSSGNGLHVYWTFTKAVDKALWVFVARLFKQLTEHFGLQADPSRTADLASVLRPILTKNFKDPLNPKDVDLVGPVTPPIRFSEWSKQIATVAQGLGIKPKAARASQKNSDLSAQTYAPSDANRIADRCRTIGHMRDFKGLDQDEPLWYACLSVVSRAENGDDFCHAWSVGHADYEFGDCQTKIDQAREKSAPVGCAVIRAASPHCAECTLKCEYPIVLGRADPENTEEVTTPEGEVITFPEMPLVLRDNYLFSVEKGGLCKRIDDKENPGNHFWVPIAPFFPTIEYCYRDPEGEHWVHLRIYKSNGSSETSEIRSSTIAQGGSTFAGVMGGRIGRTPRDIQGVVEFMRTWYDQYRDELDLQHMRRQMGWQEDDHSFILGDRQYFPDETVKQCSLAKELTEYAKAHIPKGDLADNTKLLTKLYNRPGFEPYQFILAAGLGSILLPLAHNGPIGVPIVLWSPLSGGGKTTVCQQAIALWGNPQANGQFTNADNATEYAMFSMAGVRKNLPALVDETTMWDSARAAKFAYMYSAGTAKLQGKAEGGLRDNSVRNWANFLFMTGNKSIVDTIATDIANSGPQVARVFEIELPPLNISSTDRHILKGLEAHYGMIGDAFLKFVVKNREHIVKVLDKEIRRLQDTVDEATDARYWVYTAACVNVANTIANVLGLWNFSPANLRIWTELHLRRLRGVVTDNIEDSQSTAGRMMLDLVGGLLVTDKLGGGHGANAKAVFDPDFPPPRTRALTGRYVVSTGDLYLPCRTVKKWCHDTHTDYSTLRRRLMTDGILKNTDTKIYITVGTHLGKLAQQRCWLMHLDQQLLRVVGADGD